MDKLKKSPDKPLIPPVTNNPIIIGMPPPMVTDDSYVIVDDTVNQYSFIHPFTAKIQTSNVLLDKIFNENQIIEGREVTIKGDSGEKYVRYQLPPETGSGDMHTNIYIPISYLKKDDTPKSTAAEKKQCYVCLFWLRCFCSNPCSYCN